MKTITERGGGDIIFTNCFSGVSVDVQSEAIQEQLHV